MSTINSNLKYPICLFCGVRTANILYSCTHTNTCSQCTSLFKKCPECKEIIKDKLLCVFAGKTVKADKLMLIPFRE